MRLSVLLLVASLCAPIAPAGAGDKQAPRPKKPRKGDVKLRLKHDPDHMIFWGRKIGVGRWTPSESDQANARKLAAMDARDRASRSVYVQDPANPSTSALPNPPGVQAVRAVLNQYTPVPQDRLNYFAPLARDPLAEAYPIGGWWIYVKDVEPRPDGWIANVMVTVAFDWENKKGPARLVACTGYWCERYQLAGDTLSYLGGHFDPPLESFRVPRIAVVKQ